jgi:trimeric autotransporter adhesin
MGTYRRGLSFTGLFLLLGYGSIARASSLGISSAVVNPGGTATLAVALTVSGTAPAGLEWTIAYSPGQISGISLTPGPAAAKTLYCSSSAGAVVCVLTGLNTNGMASSVVAYLNATVAPGTTAASIQISNTVGVDSSGNRLAVAAAGGTITVPSLMPVTCSPASLNAGASGICTVTLTQAAPAGGSTVTSASNNTSLTVPASVAVAAGATTATFGVTAATIASNQSATVTATLGSSSQTATISLIAPVLVSSVACSPASLGQSAVSACTVTLTQTASAGGSSVTLASNNTSLTVPASVLVTAGAATASFNATAAASIASNESATVTATLGGRSNTAAIGLLAPILVSSLACSPTSLAQSAVTNCTVTLTQTAPAGGAGVTLASNNTSLTLPAAITVAAGAATATFSATAAASIASNQSATVTATLSGRSQTATIGLLAPVLVSGMACSPTSLGQSAVSTCSLTLTQTAPAGGSSVMLANNNASLTVPASITVAAGAATATFSATAAASIASNQSATMTATLNGSSRAATISLLAPVLVSAVACSPASLGPSAAGTCTVTLTQTAIAGGASVKLAANNTLLTVPASVTVAAGAITATFGATAAASIASNQSATITATLGNSSSTATISLSAPVLVSSVACGPTSLGQNAVSACMVTLSQTAPAGGSSVALASNKLALTVPASVTVAAAAATATFSAIASASIASNQSATITATLGNSSSTATIGLSAPVLVSSVVCSPANLGQSAVSACTVTLTQVAPAGGAGVTLASNNTLLTLPASVTVAAGAAKATFSATAAASITSNQSATIMATLGGSSSTATIGLSAPVLVSSVACGPTSLGQNAVSTCTLTLTQSAPAGGSSVTLTSNKPALTVPASVMVGAGASTATFSAVTSASIASSQSATITATLGGSSSMATIGLSAPVLVSSVACGPTSLGQNAVSTCTLTLTQTAPAGGSSVMLASNKLGLTVPASVTVGAGAATATFSAIASASIASNQSATVTATLGGSSQTATISLLAPVLVSSVACSPTSLGQSAVSTCTLILTQTAPAGGSGVTLASNNTSLTLPASVTVAAGATTATFSATAAASIASNQSATVTATLSSSPQSAAASVAGTQSAIVTAALSSQTATVNLLAPVLVSSLACSPTSLGQSGVTTCTVTLTQTAPAGGSSVTLASNNTSLTVPTSVTVAAGATTATLSAAAAASIASNQSATVTASLGNSSQTATINLVAPVLVSGLACIPAVLGPGGSSNCNLNLTQAFPGISLVNVTSCGPQTFRRSPCTIPATGSGNLIVVGWQADEGASTSTALSSITDNAGNTYAEAGNALSVDSATGSVADIWYAGSSMSGATTLTITPSSSVTNGVAVIWEFSGADLSAPLDQTAVLNSQTASAAPSGAAVTTSAGADVVVSLAAMGGSVTGISSGNNFVSDAAVQNTGWAYLITSSAGTYAAQWNQSPAGTYAASTAAFKAAGSVILTSNSPLLGIPASVTVPVGATTAAFSATAAANITGNQSAAVTATLGGSSQAATISLLAPMPVPGVACNPASIGQSGVSTCTVTLTQTAPAGGSNLTPASSNTLLTVPASVAVAAGASTATFSATAAASIPSNQSATVTLGGSSQSATISLLAPVPAPSVACSPASIGQSGVSNCTVTLTQTAPAGGSSVTLASSNTSLTVPASVTVAAGAATATFSATAAASIAGNQSATVTVTFGGSSQTASVSLLAPALVSNVTCSPTSLVQSSVSTCTVTLTRAASTGGSSVTLTSSNSSLTVPASVTVTAGAMTATFSATAAASIAGNQSAAVTATLGGSSQSATITLLVQALISRVVCSPASLGQSAVSSCTVTLNQAAPAGGSSLTPASNSALLTVPASVTIAPGATTVSFNATAGATIASNQTASVTATLGGSSASARISLLAPALVSSVACNPNSMGSNAAGTCTVTFGSSGAGPGGAVVTLQSNNNLLAVPLLLAVPPGATTSSFQASTGSFTTAQTATVTASLNGSAASTLVTLTARSSTRSVTVTSISPPAGESNSPNAPSTSSPGNAVSSMLCTPAVITAGGTLTCELLLAPSPQSMPVALNSASKQVLVPSVVMTRPNQSSLTFQARTSPLSGTQPVTITAAFGDASVEDTVQLMAPSGPILRVPERQVARVGEPISFAVNAVDPSDLPLQVGVTAQPIGASFDPVTGAFEWSPQISQAGKYRITFTATNSARQSSSAQVEIEVDSGLPALNASASSCSPGAIATLRGRSLAETGSQHSDPSGASFDLGGTSVTVNNRAVPVLYSSPDRVDFLCPTAEAGTQLSVQVTSRFGLSQPVTVGMTEAVPTILSTDDSQQNLGLILFDGMNDLVMERNFRVPAHPAQPGDQIVILATGLGSAPDSGLGTMQVRLSDVYVGAESVQAVPGHAGVSAILVRVPAAMTFGAVPVQLQMTTLDGHQTDSNSVTAVFEAIRQ